MNKPLNCTHNSKTTWRIVQRFTHYWVCKLWQSFLSIYKAYICLSFKAELQAQIIAENQIYSVFMNRALQFLKSVFFTILATYNCYIAALRLGRESQIWESGVLHACLRGGGGWIKDTAVYPNGKWCYMPGWAVLCTFQAWMDRNSNYLAGKTICSLSVYLVVFLEFSFNLEVFITVYLIVQPPACRVYCRVVFSSSIGNQAAWM